MEPTGEQTLTGRTAVVTGGAQGIGAAISEALSAAGARVVVVGRRPEPLNQIAERLPGCVARVCDVMVPSQITELADFCTSEFGTTHILVNNAGVASAAPLAHLELEEWNRLLAVNATGPFLCTKAFLPGMLKEGFGRVITIASTAALSGAPYISGYTASKHAALGFVRAMAAELAGKGVTVNAVCPGYVDTEMTAKTIEAVVAKTGRSPEEALQSVLRSASQERLVTPEEVAFAVVSLCQDSQATGQAVELT